MTVPAPSNLSFGKVVWQTVSDITDGSDPDVLPDFIAPTGTVTFVASMVAGRDITATPNPVTIVRDPIIGVLDSSGYLCTPNADGSPGTRGVWLIATDDPDLNPADWVYTVTYQVKGQNGRGISLRSHQITVPTDGTVDLTTVGPVDNANQVGIPAAEAAAAAAVAAALEAQAAAVAAADALADADPLIASKVSTPGTDTNLAVSAQIETLLNAGIPPAVAAAIVAVDIDGKVTAAIAGNPTFAAAVTAATAPAVTADLAGRSGIPAKVTDDGSGDALVWLTELGSRFLASITQDGYLKPARGLRVEGADIKGNTETDSISATVASVPELAHERIFEDEIGPDGNVPPWVLKRWSARMPLPRSPKGLSIIMRSDSMFVAFSNGASTVQRLSALLPGIPIEQRCNPGERAKEISMRQGSTPLTNTAAVTIPASGPTSTFAMNTSSIFTNPNGTNGTPDGLAMVGKFNGVKGVLTATGGVFTFTRASAGDSVNVPAGTPWLDDFESTHRSWNQIIWVGRNNVTATPTDAVLYAQKIAAYQTAGDYLVLSVCNATDEPSGSANYNTIIGMNAALASAFPGKYFDLRAALISGGLAAAGLTPTAADTAAISEDRIPPSLLNPSDGKHLNEDGHKAAAALLLPVITAKGWI